VQGKAFSGSAAYPDTVDRRRKHHEVAPWYLADVPEGEWRSCDALTQNVDWTTGEQRPCSRSAHVMYGELALCWQHESSVVYYLPGDERSVPVGMAETRFAYGALEELETWLSAKRVRDAREAKEAEEAAAELARREAEAETRRAAARAARRSRPRAQRPNHLRSVE
jgi:hypothetical protein